MKIIIRLNKNENLYLGKTRKREKFILFPRIFFHKQKLVFVFLERLLISEKCVFRSGIAGFKYVWEIEDIQIK